MLAWSDDALQIVLCSGTGPAISVGSQQEHHAHHAQYLQDAAHAQYAHDDGQAELGAHHEHEQHGSASHGSSYCPFAVASSAAPLGSSWTLVSTDLSSETIQFVADVELASASVLVDRIRGPPRV